MHRFWWCCRSDFRDGRTPILVATDVAARGLGKWQFSFCIVDYNLGFSFFLRIFMCLALFDLKLKISLDGENESAVKCPILLQEM